MVVNATKRQEFLNWSLRNGVVIHENVRIGPSEVGGIGAFFDLDQYIKSNGKLKEDDRIEVLRIPKRLTLSLDTISESFLTPQITKDAEAKDDYIKQSSIFLSFLSHFQHGFEDLDDPFVRGGLNETNILVGELQILIILKIVRERLLGSNIDDEYKEFLKDSPFASLDPYLDILLNTDVGSLKLDTFSEEYKELFKYFERQFRYEIEDIKNKAVWVAIEDLDIDHVFKDSFDKKFLRKIEISVISRILEIPETLKSDHIDHKESNEAVHFHDDDIEASHASPDDHDHDHDSDEEKFAFAVSSTLVPVIDFVNHSNDNPNSVFDVDPENGDVLLKIRGEYFIGGQTGEQELFITYSETEDVLRFAHAYGFIPKSVKKPVLYDHSIDRDFLAGQTIKTKVDDEEYTHSLSLVLKWLGIQPSVQFLVYSNDEGIEDLRLNLDDNLIIFAFSKGLTYHREHALKIFEHMLQDEEISKELTEELLKMEESIFNDVVETLGVTPFSSAVVGDLVSLQTLVEGTSDEEVNRLIVEFIDFIANYFQFRLAKLEEFLKVSEKQQHESIVVQFAQFEKRVAQKFLDIVEKSSDEDKLELILGVDDLDDEWLKFRLKPIYPSTEIKQQLRETYSLGKFEGLSLGKAEESE